MRKIAESDLPVLERSQHDPSAFRVKNVSKEFFETQLHKTCQLFAMNPEQNDSNTYSITMPGHFALSHSKSSMDSLGYQSSALSMPAGMMAWAQQFSSELSKQMQKAYSEQAHQPADAQNTAIQAGGINGQ